MAKSKNKKELFGSLNMFDDSAEEQQKPSNGAGSVAEATEDVSKKEAEVVEKEAPSKEEAEVKPETVAEEVAQPNVPETKEVKEEIPEVEVELEIEEPAEKKVEDEPEQEAVKEEPSAVAEEQLASPEVPEQTPVVEAEPKADEPAEVEAPVEKPSTVEDSSEAEQEVKSETAEKKESKSKKQRKSKAIKLTTERAVVTVTEDGDKKGGKFFEKDGITISNDELLSVRNTKSLYTNSDGWDKMQFLKSRMGLESANQLMDFILRYDKTRGLDKWTMSWEEERELMHKQSEQRKMPASERKRITFRVSKEADEHLSDIMGLIPAIKMSTIVNKMFNDFFEEYNNLLKNR